MKVVILANDDLTGSLIFSPIVGMNDVSLQAVFFGASPVKSNKSMISAAFSLRRRMAFSYWLFLVVTNGLFSVFSALSTFLRRPGSLGDLDSLRAHATMAGVPIHTGTDFESDDFKRQLAGLSPDLVLIRVSSILDAEVLSIPRVATWCVHSSLLPAYGGIAGEFHALREGREFIGSTVFQVTERLDEGPPVAQVRVRVQPGSTLFSHIIANNHQAGYLLARMVADIAAGRDPRRPLLNADLSRSYFSWPNEAQLAQFRQRGWRLVSASQVLRLVATALRLDWRARIL